MRFISLAVQQQEGKMRVYQIHMRGTVNAAALEGDPNFTKLVASSVYEPKPVHYLNMICKNIKWVEVEKDVYNLKFQRQNFP